MCLLLLHVMAVVTGMAVQIKHTLSLSNAKNEGFFSATVQNDSKLTITRPCSLHLHPQLSYVFFVADDISVQSWKYSCTNML